MKNLLLAAFFTLTGFTYAQQCSDAATKEVQKKLNEEYANPKTSPLPKKDLKKFKSLDFFAVNLKYCVTATITRTPNEKPFYMATTNGRKSQYIKYGEAHFTIDGKPYKLNVYQSLSLMQKEEYKDYLFLPFTDDTNGETTYAGGRYIDLKLPAGNTLQIDFNRAYNPYCAYNHDYSCPIPPRDNYLETKIEAGVKTYKK